MPYNTKKIRHAYKSKHNLNHENQVIVSMITDGKKWHYLVIKCFTALLRGITLNHQENFYCLNRFNSYRAENKLKEHKVVFKKHDYYYVEIPEENNKILKYNHGEKSMKLLFLICAEIKCLLKI